MWSISDVELAWTHLLQIKKTKKLSFDNADYEVLDQFCYVGSMLSKDVEK